MSAITTILCLGNTAPVQPLTASAERIENFIQAFKRQSWQVINLKHEDQFSTLANALDTGGTPSLFVDVDIQMSEENAWESVRKQLSSRIDCLFVADMALWRTAQKIKTLAEYKHVPVVVDIANEHSIPDGIECVDYVFVPSQKLLELVKARGVRKISIIRDGVRVASVDEYFFTKWRSRMHSTWALFPVPEGFSEDYEKTINSFGGSLGCVPINSSMVFVGGDSYTLAKRFRECTFGELNISRLKTIGDLRGSDYDAVAQLAPIYVLGNFSGDEHFSITAQALYSKAKIVAYASALIGFEAFVGREHVVVVDDLKQFRRAVREVYISSLTPTSMNNMKQASKEIEGLTATACFAKAPAILLSLIAQS